MAPEIVVAIFLREFMCACSSSSPLRIFGPRLSRPKYQQHQEGPM